MNILDSAVQFVKKNDSKLLLGASIILGGVTIVTTIKSTRKVEPILAEHNEKLNKVHMAADIGVKINEETKESVKCSEKELRKDIFVVYVHTFGKLVKLYRVPIATGVGSLALNLTSFKLLDNKVVGLEAAVAGVAQTFSGYRNYISEKYGKEVDTEAMYGIKPIKKKGKNSENEPIEYTPVESEDGVRFSNHSRLLDEFSGSNIWNKERQSVLNSLVTIEASVKRKLKYRRSHTVTFNEITDMLDVAPSVDGNVMGIVFKPGDKLDKNGLPDIRIFDYWLVNSNGKYVRRSVDEEFSNPTTFEPAILLDFPSLVYIG